ncbi:MAG: hypothetical protein WAV86_02715 [Lutibacter sp.]
MKEIDFIGSENVVNIASLGKIIIIDELANYNNGFISVTSINNKININLKNNGSAHLSAIYFKNSEAYLRQSYFNKFNKKISYAKRNINANQ